MTCVGDTQYICGGSSRISLYEYDAAPVSRSTTGSSSSASTTTSSSTIVSSSASTSPAAIAAPVTVSDYNGWTAVGCYVDSVADRTIPVGMGTPGGPVTVTVELCLDACYTAGYIVTDLEYSQECYYGNTLPPQLAIDGRCNMLCNGNQLE